MTDAILRQVGVVRSPITERQEMPTLGAPAAVEIFEEFAPALLHFEKHTHVWVLAWLDTASRDPLQVTPRAVRGQGPDTLHGVFALRAPSRPNPIGLSAARVTSRSGLRIELDLLDFVDGTPVIDLKPYFVTRDLIFSARNAQIGRPADREALVEALLLQGSQFHGELCDDVRLAADIVANFRGETLGFKDPENLEVEAPLQRPHLVDALMGMTRASLGRGTLRLIEQGVVRLADREKEYAQAV
jgi:tRNA-Thr(GGU) m(6)t(6)A37 methyltransferase TsaA